MSGSERLQGLLSNALDLPTLKHQLQCLQDQERQFKEKLVVVAQQIQSIERKIIQYVLSSSSPSPLSPQATFIESSNINDNDNNDDKDETDEKPQSPLPDSSQSNIDIISEGNDSEVRHEHGVQRHDTKVDSTMSDMEITPSSYDNESSTTALPTATTTNTTTGVTTKPFVVSDRLMADLVSLNRFAYRPRSN